MTLAGSAAVASQVESIGAGAAPAKSDRIPIENVKPGSLDWQLTRVRADDGEVRPALVIERL